MENPRLLLDGIVSAPRKSSGIWSVEANQVVNIAEFDEGPSVGLVKTEHVLLLAVELPPITNLAKRRQLLPFAVEERIADRLEDVHVALGEQLAPNVFLAGVVRHDLMREWIGALEAAELFHCSLVPDALALPVPGDLTWAVDIAADRALVRAADGTGFAIPVQMLEQAWVAAGRPHCSTYGDPLPPEMETASVVLQAEPLAERLILPSLDLRQGPYALPRRRLDPLWKRVAMVAALGAAAHLVIAVADAMALRRIADERETEVRELAQNMQPSLVIGADLGATVAELTPEGPVGPPSAMVPLLARSGAAVATVSFPVAWRAVRFSNSNRNLTLELGVAGNEQMAALTSALKASGLNVTPGPARNEGALTLSTFTVSG
ncbi:type II secretion system protein GspL [Tsuneonella sp. HG222]